MGDGDERVVRVRSMVMDRRDATRQRGGVGGM